MPSEIANIHKTNEGSVTGVLPKTAREMRAEKALAIVKAIMPPPPEPPKAVPFVPPIPDQTYTYWEKPNDTLIRGSIVYFMYGAGRVKIGFSTGLVNRHRAMKLAHPFPPVVLLVIDGGEKLEREFHKRFAADRLHGEWFALSVALRRFLMSRLCGRGRASLEAAEAQFRDYCESFVEGYKPPAKRKPEDLCSHGKPKHHRCQPCERDRDLAILATLQMKETTP